MNLKSEIIVSRTWNYDYLEQWHLNDAFAFLNETILSYGAQLILGVGLLVEGYFKNGICHDLPIKNIREQAEEMLDVEIFMLNDVKGIATAEAFYAEIESDFLLVKYGSRVEGAMVLKGEVRSGIQGNAGALGHILWDHTSPIQCPVCGRMGCLESIVGFKQVMKNTDPAIQFEHIEAETVFTAGNNDDQRSLYCAIDTLAQAISVFAEMIDLEKVVLVGEIFTMAGVYERFVQDFERFSQVSVRRAKRIENYEDKRKKAAGAVVLNQYFGSGLRKL